MKAENIHLNTNINYLGLIHLPSLVIGIIIGIILIMVIAAFAQLWTTKYIIQNIYWTNLLCIRIRTYVHIYTII